MFHDLSQNRIEQGRGGGNYTVVLEVAKGNVAACTAAGLVNYVHG